MRSLRDAPIKKGTRVILRADFDVPLKNGKIADDFRIREDLPAIKHILKKGGFLRIISHLGRPGGKRAPELNLMPVAKRLERLLRRKVVFIQNPFPVSRASAPLILLENIRFWPGEEKNSRNFARSLADWGEIYVNEAFANSHRKHASMAALPELLPSYPGFNLEKEMAALEKIMSRPKRPLVAVIGGAKFETKMPAIINLLKIADHILVGGALANEFLRRGSRLQSRKILFSQDGPGADGSFKDIGPKTIRRFVLVLRQARTVVWSGPLGIAEIPQFAEGTKAVAQALVRSKAFTVVGGGHTIAALRKYGLLNGFSHISTGGGAMLEFLAGKKLPGIEVLKR